MASSKLFRHILVPHDFSAQATVALKAAAQLAKEHRGRLTVLHVAALVPPYPSDDVPFAMPAPGVHIPELREQLQRLVAKKLGGGPPANVRVEIGDAAQRILAASRRVSSIIMATSGRTGFARFLIGSVAERVVRHATVPVLTLRVPVRKRPGARRK
jgi:nucleotide-binding universal stress UspA family protein